MLILNQRTSPSAATPSNVVFAMCPAVLVEASMPNLSAIPAMYRYAFQQAQRIVAAQRPRFRYEAFHLN